MTTVGWAATAGSEASTARCVPTLRRSVFAGSPARGRDLAGHDPWAWRGRLHAVPVGRRGPAPPQWTAVVHRLRGAAHLAASARGRVRQCRAGWVRRRARGGTALRARRVLRRCRRIPRAAAATQHLVGGHRPLDAATGPAIRLAAEGRDARPHAGADDPRRPDLPVHEAGDRECDRLGDPTTPGIRGPAARARRRRAQPCTPRQRRAAASPGGHRRREQAGAAVPRPRPPSRTPPGRGCR